MLIEYAKFEKYRVMDFRFDHSLQVAKICPYPEDMQRQFKPCGTYR